MQNIDVRFSASTNFAKARADVAALNAQVAALNKTMQEGAYSGTNKMPPALDPGRWANATRAVETASDTYRKAASSSGLFTTQQIRAVSETERFTKALQQQKLTLGDMVRNRGIMQNVYRDQLKMQRMTAQYWGTDTQGRGITDITLPKNVPTELDNWRRRMGFFGNAAASAGTQIVNLGKNIQWSGRQLTVGFTYPMAMFGAAAGVMAYKVEDAFASINKVYDFSSKAFQNQAQMEKEQNDLRTKSMQNATVIAQKYGQTVTSTLKVEQELAATGLKGNSLMSTTTQVQRISALGDIDPQQTEQMVVALQTAFRKTIPDAKSLTETLNFMNAASNATSLSLQDIAEAVPRAASGFAALGGNAKDMTVLLVSMREAGVQAAQGANAIKSAATRVLNPVPKAVEFYKQYQINVSKMAEDAGGNLFDFLKKLGVAQDKIQGKTEKQTRFMRAQGIATLFGTYQNNRLTAALTNLTEAYGGANNQTAKALALEKETPKALAATAEASRKAMMDNPAGKLREEWAKFQIQLSKMGEPFLKVGADILAFFTKIASAFNNSSPTFKNLVMWGAAAAAIAGPMIMITGLMFNMAGQFIKGVAAISKFLGISTLLTKEQKAAQLTTTAENEALAAMNGMTEQSIALTDTLAAEIAALAEAMAMARQQANLGFSAPAAIADDIAAIQDETKAVVDGEAKQQMAIEDTIKMIQAKNEAMVTQAEAMATYGKNAQYQAVVPQVIPPQVAPTVPGRLGTGFRGESVMMADTEGQLAAQASLDARVAALNKENALRAQIANKANAEAVISGKTQKYVNGTSVSMAIMGASMATMMLTSNKTAHNIAEWAMIGTIVTPALKTAGMAAATLGTKLVASATEAKAAFLAARAASLEMTAAAGGLRAGISAGASGLVGMIGPAGIIAATVAVIGGGFLLWKKHEDAIISSQLKAQNSLTDMADDWGKAMGRVEDHYKGIHDYSINIARGGGLAPDQYRKDLDYYRSGGGKTAATTLGGMTPTNKDNSILNTYVGLITRWGLTAKQARTNITALLVASGQDFYTATQNAKNYAAQIGNLKGHTIDWSAAVKVGSQYLKDLQNNGDKSEAQTKELSDAVGKFGQVFANAFTNAKTPAAAKQMFGQLVDIAHQGWTKIYAEAQNTQLGQEFLKAHNLKNVNQFRNFAENDPNAGSYAGIGKMVSAQKEYEAELVRSVSQALQLQGTVKTIADLQASLVVQASQWNYNKALSQTKELASSIVNGPTRAIMALVDPKFSGKSFPAQLKEMLQNLPTQQLDQITRQLFIIADSQGITKGKNAWQTYNNILNNVQGNLGRTQQGIQRAAEGTKGLANDLNGLPGFVNVDIKMKEVGGIVQSAMQSTEADMASAADNRLQAQQTAAMNALQARQQGAQNAMQNAQQAAQTAMDNRFKKRQDEIQKSFQKRIDAVNKEIQAEQNADKKRQAMYEAEKARLQNLADMQNNTIDFNQAVNEGRLDDAAKIANDAEAKSMQNELDREEAAASARTQTRIDALQKKADRLTKQRDSELKTLQKLEDREKAHLQKVQQMRSQALQKQQTAETNALQASQDAEKANLDAKLALFQTYVAKNQKDLQAWMKQVGLTYDDFGVDITNKGEGWASSFQTALMQHIRQAGVQVLNDKMWSNIGTSMGLKLLKGIGFTNKAAFTNFVKTGNLPKSFSKGTQTNHGGGLIGDGGSGRAGFSGDTKRGERMVLARDDEFMVNAQATKRNRRLLEQMNRGSSVEGRGARPVENFAPMVYPHPTSYAPVGGEVAGVIANMYEQGLSNGMSTGMAKLARSRESAIGRKSTPGTSIYNGPIGKTTGIGRSAIHWAVEHMPGAYKEWYYRCLSFVRQAFGAPGLDINAATGWDLAKNKHGIGNASKVPAGVPVWWHGGSGGDGHVALSTGGGNVISTDYPTLGYVGTGTIRGITSNWGEQLMGWSEDINGKRIFDAAWLRKGGKLKWDNTPVIGHKGETMLSAPLTKAFEQRVAGEGNSQYTVTIDLRGAYIKEDIDLTKAVKIAIQDIERNKPRSKVVRSRT